MTFYFFKCSNAFMYLVTDKPSVPDGVTECKFGKWLPAKKIDETGEPRFAFSEEEAKKDIAEKGYQIIRSTVEFQGSAKKGTFRNKSLSLNDFFHRFI